MKKWLAFMFISILFFGLAGCSNNEAEIKAFVKEYKTKQYTVTDPAHPPDGREFTEEFKGYLSDELYEKMMINRFYDIIPKFSERTGFKIELKDVKLEEVNTEDDLTSYKYTLELLFDNGEETETIERKGELTISTEDKFKLTRDWENRTSEIWGEKF
ncbi:hypothetical protein [Cytobacillus purgationiresistens]|uniref:Lipoprotein n=1 Tax=Cytobacillus purgationiresistens TaxID=863449 RepID=A0ABU0AJD5_9BACI|nr:hypothetical protein [Cytobacillus purgationiresistens]MDQ0271379.1 hypothetical protein [Cytobacillus purgationiresistens]